MKKLDILKKILLITAATAFTAQAASFTIEGDPLEALVAVDNIGNDGDAATFYVGNGAGSGPLNLTQAFTHAYGAYYNKYGVYNGHIYDGSSEIGRITIGGIVVSPPLTFGPGTTDIAGGTFNGLVTASSGAIISISGNTTLQEGLTANGAIIELKLGASLTIPPGKQLNLTNTRFKMAVGSSLVINGEVITKLSAMIFSGGVNISGTGNMVIDPSFLYSSSGGAVSTVTNTIGVPLVVGGVGADTFNVLMADSNAPLIITASGGANTLTLNNKTVLVVGYNASSITSQALSTLISVPDGIVGTGTSSGAFDHIFTLALDNLGASTGILQPIDATVTNNAGTYAFNVVQSNTGVQLEITSGAQPEVGSDVDAIVAQLLFANPPFFSFMGPPISTSFFSFRLESVTNALVGARELGKSSIEVNTDSLSDFRFKPVLLTKNMSPEKKLESIFTALAEGGPISKSNNEYRVWVSPFSEQSNVGGSLASRSWLLGSLVGTEYRSKSGKYTLGLLGGMNFGNQRSKRQVLDGSNIKGVNMGTYAAWGAWEGGRIDGLYIRSLNWLKESRKTNNAIALNDHKATIDIIDLQTSHVFKLLSDIWSVRFNIGHTYSHTNSQGYTEYNVPQQFLNQRRAVGGSIGRSYEVYGGIGLRYNNRMKDWRLRITGLYEYGSEYKKAESRTRTSHGANLNIHTFNNGSSEKAKTHYATLYGTINNNEGWKFMLGYQGGFKKNIVDTSLYVKAEYRF